MARAGNYWFDFSQRKVEGYQQRYKDDFFLIVNNSDTKDNVYIFPFNEVKSYFTNANLQESRHRWVGTIKKDMLKLGSASYSIPVGKYHNRFDMIEKR
jgi:hypothetical protein